MKVNRRKTEYMCVNERQDNGSGTVKMQGEDVAKVEDFKYLGSTVQSNGECGREVKKRVQAGWNGWRRMSGVICDRRVPARVQGTMYKVAVRPAMLYGLETVALTKRQKAEMEVAELKMLRFSLGVTRVDKIRNEYIRVTAQVGEFGEKTREARLRSYGHLRRKDDGYIGRRMLRMELPGKRKRGRPKRRFMDVVKEDMAEVKSRRRIQLQRRSQDLGLGGGAPGRCHPLLFSSSPVADRIQWGVVGIPVRGPDSQWGGVVVAGFFREPRQHTRFSGWGG